MELCLGEWTPRNILRRVPEVVADTMKSGLEVLQKVLAPRLARVLAPFPEARAAVVAMFVEMERLGVPCPG